MKCYYHRQTEAVGRCKNCHKGLCTECAVDVENGLACKDRCEAEVRAVNALMERSKTDHQRVSDNYLRQAVVLLLVGIGFLIYGFMEAAGNPFYGVVPIAFGLLLLLTAVLHYSSGRKFLAK